LIESRGDSASAVRSPLPLAERIEVESREEVHSAAGAIVVRAARCRYASPHVIAERNGNADSALKVSAPRNDRVESDFRIELVSRLGLLRDERRRAKNDENNRPLNGQDEARLARALARERASV
jgi:hypothetical protein